MPRKQPPVERLTPHFNLLQEEYLLIQAWKKTVSYIRQYNWYVDTLQLDRTAINLRSFISRIQRRIQKPEWQNHRLRIVLAPKSQTWETSSKSALPWHPANKSEPDEPTMRLRPLAHVDIEEQVVATALMLCLADRVETKQGDPRDEIQDEISRKKVLSYGNRLFCDRSDNELHHRWGTTKLYRAYYQDYRKFLARPDAVVKPHGKQKNFRNRNIFVVHSDLKEFYDRVRPRHLADALLHLKENADEQPFFDFAKRVLNWTWNSRDKKQSTFYATQAGIEDFDHVALPQGLVSAGFFANIMLLEFDKKLQETIGKNITEDSSLRLEDACRYVDDLRITMTSPRTDNSVDVADVKDKTLAWLQQLLIDTAPELEISIDKTEIRQVDQADNPLINQSAKMNRIQKAVSGGFDAVGGTEILDLIQGLMRSQEALHRKECETIWPFSPLTDVQKGTVARFTAGRYRTTYRSVRPLLDDTQQSKEINDADFPTKSGADYLGLITQRGLDEDMRVFALGLIERWVADPSNVRLLRIGLDLRPDAKILQKILDMIRPLINKRGPQRSVALYCLAELFQAGATETGWVEDNESLPDDVKVKQYRKILREEATRLVEPKTALIPWYLRQQALLYLAVCSPEEAVPIPRTTQNETKHYYRMIEFLQSGNINQPISVSEFANLAVLAHRSFPKRRTVTAKAIRQQLTPARAEAIAARDLSFAYDLVTQETRPFNVTHLSTHIKEDLCLEESTIPENGMQSLASIVLENKHDLNVFQNELAVLRFAEKFLEQLSQMSPRPLAITPRNVWVEVKAPHAQIAKIRRVEIFPDVTPHSDSLYSPPNWCAENDRWRFNLGFLIRFILTGQPDFTRRVFPSAHWKEDTSTYRKAESHWYQRIHGLYNGQQAFGGDWVPVTDWVEQFVLALLRWPGCYFPKAFEFAGNGLDPTRMAIKTRIGVLNSAMGHVSGTQLLPVNARPKRLSTKNTLRICVVQTAVPKVRDFENYGLSLSTPLIRKKHRRHLSAALTAVKSIMHLRNTHMERGGELDWLIFPELAVHPKDVTTHLMPFARAYKALILAGLTYEKLPRGPYQNSAIWILPEWSESSGLQLRTRRQGKQHLSPVETKFNDGRERVQGFRPCQWLVRYPWSAKKNSRPLMLTGSICYDATDLEIVTALRKQSDVLAIPSLNPDVRTFDQMAQALHYHMFQLVIVANNGQYGGSNAYWPAKGIKKQIFHVHGQPQASITFFEIDNIEDFQKRSLPSDEHQKYPLASSRWKYPPAGLG